MPLQISKGPLISTPVRQARAPRLNKPKLASRQTPRVNVDRKTRMRLSPQNVPKIDIRV